MRHRSTSLLSGLALCAALFFVGCESGEVLDETEIAAPAAVEGEPTSVTSTLGPVTATVTVTPTSPLIGDMMSLTLEVDVKEGVILTMPASREAFHRLEVDDEDETHEVTADGQRFTQTYSIQAAASGRMRVPPMRLVFVDNRSEAEAKGQEVELLTDEVSILVRPVLEGDAATDAVLRPVRRPLEEYLGPSLWRRYWWAFVGGPAALCALVALFFVRRNRKLIVISPFERATVALSQLEAGGLPDAEALDSWYVELSHIVRVYLEGRFSVRAPDLTTEEFLRDAQRSERISAEHKALLSGFLADCDQVKFAGYAPGDEESRSVLEAARRFLLETHLETNSAQEEDVA